jgi:hypothetical protein
MLTAKALEYLKLGTGGSYSLARDAISHRIFDQRAFVAATASDYTFFQQGVGSSWVGGTAKTVNETNLYDNGKLPNGQNFLANRIGIALIAPDVSGANAMTCATVFKNIMESSIFEIRLAGREYDFQIHGRQFLPQPIFTLAASTGNGRVGDMIASGWWKLDPTPIFIDQLVSFSVFQRLGNPIAAVQTILESSATQLATYNATMMVCLDGFLTRAK